MLVRSRNFFKNILSQKFQYRFGGSSAPADQTVTQNATQGETAVFVESVTNTLKGLNNSNQVVEHDPSLTLEQKSNMKRFLIYRYNPFDPKDSPKYVSYYINLSEIKPMYLDALIYIKNNYDSSFSFRRSCREGICGSCSMNCDGLHTLSCIRAYDPDLKQTSVINPLGHMFVLKDLVVDMTNFYTQYKSIQPYLQRKSEKKEGQKEYLQTIADREKLDGLYECVLCAACSTSCPSYWWHPDRYLGPAVLQQAFRWIVDSRDEYTDERIEMISNDIRLDECQQIGMCTVTCPKGLNPQLHLEELFKMVKEYRKKRVDEEAL